MTPRTLPVIIGLTSALLLASAAPAQDTPPSADQVRALLKRIDELEQRVKSLESEKASANITNESSQIIQELDQKVKILERNRELDQEAAEAKAKVAPKISIGERGFSFTSADTNFSLGLKGLLQVDTRTFFDDDVTGNDGILLRRARPILQGTVFRDFDFMFVPDFAGSSPQIFDAYLNYRYNPALQLRAGKFKVPVGLEQLLSDKDTFFNERALPTALVPNRDLGFQLHGEPFDGVLNYAVGIFNGVGDGRNSSNVDFDDNKEFAGRVFAQPFKKSSTAALRGIGVGVAGTYSDQDGTNTAGLPSGNGYATPAQQQFFAYRAGTAAGGNHWRLSPQGYYSYGPFSLLGEYAISDQEVSLVSGGVLNSARLENTAWQIAAGWVLTGEDASFTGIVPRRPFKPSQGTWGALQLVARYSELNVDDAAFPTFSNPDVSAHAAQEWAVGLNWYLNRNLRLNTSFSHTSFSGGGGSGSSAPAAVTRNDENALFTRIQLAF